MAFPSASISGRLLKHMVVIGLLSMLAPIAAQAKSNSINSNASGSSTCVLGPGICITNVGNGTTAGLATGSAAGGLEMDGLNGTSASLVTQIGQLQGSDLGTLSFTTGALLTGSLANGGTFANGTFTITTTGWAGFTGTLFQGTFGNSLGGSPITWSLVSHVNGEYLYLLSGPISGSWEGGSTTVGGITTQIYFTSKTKYTGGKIDLSNGSTLVVTPEVSTMGLMGTALLGMAVVVRRKVKRDGEFPV